MKNDLLEFVDSTGYPISKYNLAKVTLPAENRTSNKDCSTLRLGYWTIGRQLVYYIILQIYNSRYDSSTGKLILEEADCWDEIYPTICEVAPNIPTDCTAEQDS